MSELFHKLKIYQDLTGNWFWISSICLNFISEIEIESEQSNINELSQKTELLNPADTYDSTLSPNILNKLPKTRSISKLQKHSKLMAQKSVELYNIIKQITEFVAQIIFQDSFILVRQALSIILLVATFSYVLMTVGTELLESLFCYVYENVKLIWDSKKHLKLFLKIPT